MRAQMHLRNIFVTLNIVDMAKPEIYMTFAAEKFDGEGRLIDPDYRTQVENFMTAFDAWIDRVTA
jgi:hypothetical protein